MIRRTIYYRFILLLFCLLTACASGGQEQDPSYDSKTPQEEIRELPAAAPEEAAGQQTADDAAAAPVSENFGGNYLETGGEIAFVADGQIQDGDYNEAIYEGIQTYAQAAGVSFSCYQVYADGADGFAEAVERAVSDGAGIVICSGYDFQETVGIMQDAYPETSFLLLDGIPLDDEGNAAEIAGNVHCVSFREEESGYLAGYMAVLEGYRSLGFIGGKEVPAVIRYGYGYLQGIDDAARTMALADVTVNYWYADSFQPAEKIEKTAAAWYTSGTEVIFACGGSLYESVLKAAEDGDGMLIGVDTDQSALSERFLTSAVKGLEDAVVISLDDYFAAGRTWSEECAGQAVRYGVRERCGGLPVIDTQWRFRHVTMDEYYEVCRQIKRGILAVSDETDVPPQVSTAAVNRIQGD